MNIQVRELPDPNEVMALEWWEGEGPRNRDYEAFKWTAGCLGTGGGGGLRLCGATTKALSCS